MYYIYILESEKTHRFYVGCTRNVKKRLSQHNSGLSTFTKGKGPWILKYTEKFNTLSEARSREKRIKSWKKRVAIEKLINGPIV